MPKKRFSAFEDFPVEQTTRRDAPASGLFAKNVAEEEVHVLQHPSAPQVERIERLKPSEMLPDRFQPRRLLPTPLRGAFYSGKIDCYEAARRWLEMGKREPGYQQEIDRLMSMGASFGEHGQIKPITGAWVERPGGKYVFQIETGERRFWAACLNHALAPAAEEPLLRVETIEKPTRMRQVLENRHAEPPTAVGQACEVAALILAELGQQPQAGDEDEFRFFRRWRAQRMPQGLWAKLTPVMNMTRERMLQLLHILDLPNELLELADKYRVPERVLREVLRAEPERRDELLRASIERQLTSDDLAELRDNERLSDPKERKRTGTPPDPADQALVAFKRFINALEVLDESIAGAVLDELANDYVVQGRAEVVQRQMTAFARKIELRLASRKRR